MRVTRLTLRNIMGHEEYELNVDRDFTLVEGLNGQGKSSIIEALRSVVGGGHDATLLRNGATEGEIVIVLDDSTEIVKRVTAKDAKVTVTREDVGQISAGQTYIRKLVDNVDPTQMLAERDEGRRTQFLLEALPLELDAKQLRDAVAGTVQFSDADLAGHPLVIVEKVAKWIYDERTGVNREAKAKAASIDQLSKGLPEEVDQSELMREADALEAERMQLSTDFHTESSRIRTEANAKGQTITADWDRRIEEKRKQIRELENEVMIMQSEKRSQIVETSGAATAQIESLQAAANLRAAEIRGRLNELAVQNEARAGIENTRAVVAGFRLEHAKLTEQSEALTAALERVEALKLGLLKSVPLKGVTIEDGVIHENGIPWPRINTGNRVKLAINLAKLRAKGLPLVPIDNIELLDGPTFEAFRKNAPKSGLQFIVTRVRQSGDKTPGLEVTSGGKG